MESELLNGLGGAYGDLEDWASAAKMYEQQLGIVRQLGDPQMEWITLWNLSLQYDNMGDAAAAIDYATAALQILEALAEPFAETVRRHISELRHQ